VSVGVKSNRTSHSLGTGWPEIFAGVKSHWRAASTAASLKKRLGEEAGTAEETEPDLSTRTFTTTRTVPWIVLRAFEEISGMTWFSGCACVTGPAGKLVGAMTAVREAAGRGGMDAAASCPEFATELADDATSFFTGVRSLAGVEFGDASAEG
jgi:hypothetical protein